MLHGSEKRSLLGSRVSGTIDPNARVEATIRLRRRSSSIADAACVKHIELIARNEFGKQFGANPFDVLKIKRFASAHGFVILDTSVLARTVRIAGSVASVRSAFGVDLKLYRRGTTRFRGRVGKISIPTKLSGIIEGIFGLDDRPQVRPHFRVREPLSAVDETAQLSPYSPLDVARLYDFPNAEGAAQCIAIIEVGGGYQKADFDTYFKRLGLRTPNILSVSVDGGANTPIGDPHSLDGEVALDVEIIGAIAPNARIVVYFAPNTDAGFFDAICAAVYDSLRNPTVVSISWGAPENEWTAQSLRIINSVCADAAWLGVTICVADGDLGACDTDPPTRTANVDFPSSSPYVVGCGGTKLIGVGSKIESESVWNAPAGGTTGGGVSEVFSLPPYQRGVGVTKSINPPFRVGRGVPDVAGNADQTTGYLVRVDGSDIVLGGTSAVAPLWAGLIALINEYRKMPLGFANPRLYAAAGSAGAFNDIVDGNNGKGPCTGYSARPGWDACSGLGSPNGRMLLKALLG